MGTIGTILIIASLLTHQAESVIVKSYGNKKKTGGEFFNAIICFFSMIFFVIAETYLVLKGDGVLYLPPALFIYGILSCLGFASGFYFTFLAFKCGSYANTKLVSSLGTVLTVLYGTVFLKEESNFITWTAVALIIFSAVLMNSGRRGDGRRRFSFKWLVYVLLSMLGNFIITVTKREQQIRFDSACDNEFMVISLFGAFLFLFIYGLITDRNHLGTALKSGILHGALAGMFNGLSNFLSVITMLYAPISIISPVKSGGGLLLAFVVAVLLYKEKFTKKQLISVIIGVVALVLFKIA